MIKPLMGLMLGILLGSFAPISIPLAYAKLFSVALLASLDSVFGGLRAAADETFDNTVFISGFFTNALLAAFLVYNRHPAKVFMGDTALLTFGFRIFKNLAILRRHLLKKSKPQI